MDVIELSKALISKRSVTPEDAGCQDILIEILAAAGFIIEKLPFSDVNNFWARYGNKHPLFAFAGHTDVVPPGPEEKWMHPPFSPIIHDGYLYGRGAADMKASIAAMVLASKQFVETHPNFPGSLGLLITSDEEGPAIDGTKKVVEHLEKRGEHIDYCLVGEPSSGKSLGDIIKNGRRGSLNAEVTIHGMQGHIAYPQLATNPIHEALAALHESTIEEWDHGNAAFPATSYQISNINAGTGATNIIPGELSLQFNFRYSTEQTAEKLKQRVADILAKHKLNYDISWADPSLPFLTEQGKLLQATKQAIKDVLAIETQALTTGGTSDGRFIASTGSEVVELGPVNKTIHQIDECIAIEDLTQLPGLYQRILEHIFVN